MRRNTEDIRIAIQPATTRPWTGGEDPEWDIAVLMSGGVDSSVTAMLLKKAGWNVLGITMKIPVARQCDYQRSCCGMEAGYVCRDLDIPHYYLDVREAFEKLVIEPFRRSYAEGRTPSPCVDCNTVFKFGLVWDYLEEIFGVRRMATGHYARVIGSGEHARLRRAVDLSRDQSYFLYGVPRERLEHFVLPLGDLTKQHVRDLARASRLPVARRQDSMELCFAGEGDYRNALGGLSSCKGPIYDGAGNVIGQHDGIVNYTVGQRKGLGVAAGRALYVTCISAEDCSVTVGAYDEVCRRKVAAGEVNILVPDSLAAGRRLYGKIRSQGEPAACTVIEACDELLEVEFDEPQFAPTPGQRLVLYDAEANVVAGGTILAESSDTVLTGDKEHD